MPAEALTYAFDGSRVLVSNGTYRLPAPIVIERAITIACDILIPRGLDASWRELSLVERYYLRALDIESRGERRLARPVVTCERVRPQVTPGPRCSRRVGGDVVPVTLVRGVRHGRPATSRASGNVNAPA